jgi:plastocyanin
MSGRAGTVELMTRVRGVLFTGLSAVLLLSGCSNRNPPQSRTPQSGDVQVTTGADGVQAVTLTGGDDLRFHPSTFHVHAGKVKITMKDSGTTPHDFTFTGKLHGSIPLTMHGQSNSLELTVRTPGRYPFECQLHVKENMTGTMIVDR